MQGVILAAGMGVRLGVYTKDRTKCMIEIHGRTLLERALDALVKAGVHRTIMVIGYKGEKVKDYIGNNYKEMQIIYMYNEDFETTNNIYSLWLARKYLVEDDTLLLESDLIFDEKIIEDIICDHEPNLVVVAKYQSWMDGTVTIVDEFNNITKFIPKSKFSWDDADEYYKTVNIYKFSREFCINKYLPFLEAYMEAFGKNEYYEEVLRVIAYLDLTILKAYKLKSEKWYEIDDAQDLDIASTMFAKEKNLFDLYRRRIGGYWRFSDLNDFCNLSNPFFPDDSLVEEIKYNAMNLIKNCPSSLDIQTMLASRLFNCEEDQIIVSNGSINLITQISEYFSGKIGIVTPSLLDQYEKDVNLHIEHFYSSNKDFTYSVEELKKFSEGVSCLALMNPDNPSGHYLSKSDVIYLLEHFKKQNTLLLLDETLIDFTGEEYSYSLISTDILNNYPNLVVTRNIGANYGVPGLGIEIIASSNDELRILLRKGLSNKSINSFAEYFMQIIQKYRKRYNRSCQMIGIERNRLFDELKTINFIRIIPSKANYFLCEVISDYSATQLSSKLLQENRILIEDCTGKYGINKEFQYVRIAVKSNEENMKLIRILKAMS